MDQKVQGQTAIPPPLLSAAVSAEREKEGGGGKKEEENEKKQEREKEGTAAGPPGTGGPGDPGGDQSLFSITESSLSEGNVKLKIGLQAKRMKKPPKSLENYVCRPAFRATVRHTSRGGSSVRGNRAVAAGDGASGQSQSPSKSQGKEREKSPSLKKTPATSSSLAPSGKAITPSSPAAPPGITKTPSPSQVNGGSAPAKKVRADKLQTLCFKFKYTQFDLNCCVKVVLKGTASMLCMCLKTQ